MKKDFTKKLIRKLFYNENGKGFSGNSRLTIPRDQLKEMGWDMDEELMVIANPAKGRIELYSKKDLLKQDFSVLPANFNPMVVSKIATELKEKHYSVPKTLIENRLQKRDFDYEKISKDPNKEFLLKLVKAIRRKRGMEQFDEHNKKYGLRSVVKEDLKREPLNVTLPGVPQDELEWPQKQVKEEKVYNKRYKKNNKGESPK